MITNRSLTIKNSNPLFFLFMLVAVAALVTALVLTFSAQPVKVTPATTSASVVGNSSALAAYYNNPELMIFHRYQLEAKAAAESSLYHNSPEVAAFRNDQAVQAAEVSLYENPEIGLFRRLQEGR